MRNHLELLAELFLVIHPMGLKDLLERLEAEIIRNVLARERGNVRKAAESLGIKYTTLFFKVKKYGIEAVLFETPSH
ncbi:MAG: helix-turn-helix domain-containing protein [Candidatus Aminicenantales bacterium]